MVGELELNKIYNIDCIDGMKQIDDESIDMILCDLPYGITQNKWDSIIDLDKLWEQYLRIGKKNAVYSFTSSQPFSSILVMSNIEMFKHEWIWIKNKGSNFANTVREPMKEHENVLIFSRGKWTYNPQMQKRTITGLSRVKYEFHAKTKSENYEKFERGPNKNMPELRVPSSCQKFNTETGLHPTQKPVSLFEYLIKTYSNENDIVLDNCIGSGTTAVACKHLNRRFIGFEINKEYYKIAKDRIKIISNINDWV